MTSISEFIELVTNARKRTGLVLLSRPGILEELIGNDIELIDLADDVSKHIILTDDEFISLILNRSDGKRAALLNMETFLGPRFRDLRYIQSLLSKIVIKEPLKPLFFLFYSDILYETFRDFYRNIKLTENHYFEETLP